MTFSLWKKNLSSENYGQEPDAEPEKHLLGQDAVDTLLYGPLAEGVQKFRTPSGYPLSRTL